MTTWPDEGGDSELDVMDPTAGIGGLGDDPTTSHDPAPPERSGGDEPAATVEDDWAAGEVPPGSVEHDFAGVVHVWVTPEDQRLAKIRISNRWRERLKKRPLSMAVLGAMKVAQKRAGAHRRPGLPQIDPPATSERIDQAFLDRWFLAMQETRERMDQLSADPDPRAGQGTWVGQPTVGQNRAATAEVTLGRAARTVKVQLDSSWLAGARVSEICDAIQQAHDAAYAAFVEPEYEPGEYDRLNERLAGFQAEVLGRSSNHNPGGTR